MCECIYFYNIYIENTEFCSIIMYNYESTFVEYSAFRKVHGIHRCNLRVSYRNTEAINRFPLQLLTFIVPVPWLRVSGSYKPVIEFAHLSQSPAKQHVHAYVHIWKCTIIRVSVCIPRVCVSVHVLRHGYHSFWPIVTQTLAGSPCHGSGHRGVMAQISSRDCHKLTNLFSQSVIWFGVSNLIFIGQINCHNDLRILYVNGVHQRLPNIDIVYRRYHGRYRYCIGQFYLNFSSCDPSFYMTHIQTTPLFLL